MRTRLTNRAILLFWAPLAATWLMMAVEGPFLAAVIARLPDPKFSLAAWGVAFAVAVLAEAPVIMLLSAATALVEDATSYRRLRNFANGLAAAATALLLVALIPPVWDALALTVLGVPPRVADLTYGALWFFLPWPAAIGYRRFVQGVLIRADRTRLVALGTVLRLLAMGGAALALAVWFDLPGAWVGTAALGTGVCVEAVAARWMARGVISKLLSGELDFLRAEEGGEAGAEDGPLGEGAAAGEDPPMVAAPTDGDRPVVAAPTDPESTGALAAPEYRGAGGSRRTLDYRTIARFYYPLALTSFLGLTVQPMLTFFMARAPAPVESLAVFPVVHALSFIFRALGLSYQDAAIALLGDRQERFPDLARFAGWLGLASSAVLAAIVFTPLASVWFVTISGLTPELAAFALTPARILVPIPALAVLFSFQRGILMQRRWTDPITVATAVEVAVVAVLFVSFGWGVGLVGATAAFLAFLGGRMASAGYLVPKCLRVLRASGVLAGSGRGDRGGEDPPSPGTARVGPGPGSGRGV